MEILQSILLLAILAVILYLSVTLFLRRKRQQKPVSENKQMLVAVRRRQAGIARVMELPAEEQARLLKALETQWRIVNSRWLGYSRYEGGFVSDANGLPAPGQEDWRLIYLFEIDNYDHFRNCVKILESEEYALLRQHLEIRMLCGESIKEHSGKLVRIY